MPWDQSFKELENEIIDLRAQLAESDGAYRAILQANKVLQSQLDEARKGEGGGN